MVDDAYVSTHANTIRGIFENPGVREWWSSGVNTGFPARVKEWIETNAAAFYEGESVKSSSSGEAGGD